MRWQRSPSIGSGLCQSICHTLLSLKLSKRRKAAQAQASQAFRAHPPISHGCATAQVIINVNGCVYLLVLPVSCMLSQEAAKKGKDAMLNEHERHQIELNSMRQSSRKQHQKLKELLPALLAPWHQHCCRRRDLERAYRNQVPLGETLREGMSRELESGHAPNFAHLDPCTRKDLAKAYCLKAASLHPEKAGGHQLLCAVELSPDCG